MGTNKFIGPSTPIPMAEVLVRDFPEVETAVRMNKNGNRNVVYQDKSFYEDNFFYVDSNFFDLFTVKFIKGDKKALMLPKSMVVTDKIARKYFGNEDPIGKTLRVHNSDSAVFQITAVVEELPARSHFHFDFLVSTSSDNYYRGTFWLSNNLYTYILLKDGASASNLEAKFPGMIKKYCGPLVSQYMGISFEDFGKSGSYMKYQLQRLTDIHLHSNMDFEIEPNGSMSYVYIFIVIAIFILFNACINFTNLATARSANRAKEVGLRKVVGGNRSSLIVQFLSESVFISLISVIVGVVLVELLLQPFGNLINQHIDLTTRQLLILSPVFFLFALFVGVLSGGYPAFYLSSFIPYEVLKGKVISGSANSKLRGVLVVSQFTISIFILLGTFLVSSQLKYIQNKKLGFDKEQLIVIERTDPIKKDVKVFMEELKRNPIVSEVALSQGVPGRLMNHNGFLVEGAKTAEPLLFATYGVSYDYQKAMGIELAQGRFLSQEFPGDSISIVINESAAKYMGLTEPLGKRVITPGDPKQRVYLTIVGVIKDFHFESLHKPINPMILYLDKSFYDGYITVKIAAGKNREALSYLDNTWKKFSMEAPLTFFYFDKEFDKLYKSEFETRRLMSVFSVLSIVIAMLGLFGLVSFMAERRTREIGIRKVMGSSVISIVFLLSKNITILVAIAFVIASGLVYYAANQWLQQFSYRIGINLWLFVLGGLLALVIAWITISFQAIKAALRNPADSLRYE
jgi:putative ABC transport system permease protein